MYKIFTSNNKVKKRLSQYIAERKDIASKLDRLKINPSEFTEGKLFYQLSNC